MWKIRTSRFRINVMRTNLIYWKFDLATNGTKCKKTAERKCIVKAQASQEQIHEISSCFRECKWAKTSVAK